MGGVEKQPGQDLSTKDVLFLKKRWILLAVAFFIFLTGLIPSAWPIFISIPVVLVGSFWLALFLWASTIFILILGYFIKKLGLFLLDIGIYPYRMYAYIYTRFYLRPFREETVSELMARHTARKLKRHERRKYARKNKK